MTPSQLGKQELYTQVPFTAVFGLQKSTRNISQAFASYAAELDVNTQTGLSNAERELRSSRASMMILDELEFDAQVVTTPLVFAIIVAASSQFLVGYNTGTSHFGPRSTHSLAPSLDPSQMCCATPFHYCRSVSAVVQVS